LVANKLAVKSLIANCGYSEEQEEVFRLSFIYNLVAYFSVEQPDALETKNDLKQVKAPPFVDFLVCLTRNFALSHRNVNIL
jgi:hypothetical protein